MANPVLNGTRRARASRRKKTATTRRPRSKASAKNETTEALIALGQKVLEDEASAVRLARSHLNGDFASAVRAIAKCKGRLVVTGMGKTNFVAQKISATFASTGTPSFALHPADALHGDLGRLTDADIVLALSHSGETEEMTRLIGPVKQMRATILAVTATKSSTLGRNADLTVSMGKWEEAGFGLAPTTSTTVMLAVGDALAMAVLKLRGFTTEEFKQFHPAGSLGRKLMHVEDVMRKGKRLPKVHRTAKLSKVIVVMTETPGRPGAATVVDKNDKLLGIFTDGDLRRLIETGTLDLDTPVHRVMSKGPKTVHPKQNVNEAAEVLREHSIDQVPAVDDRGRSVGLLDVQDLLALGLM